MKFIREHNKVYAKDEKGELLAEVVFPKSLSFWNQR